MTRSLTFPLVAIALGYFILSMAWQWRADFWLLEDSQPGVAVLTNKYWSGHGIFEYEYVVDQKHYTGRSRRNSEDEKYRNAGVGGKTVVYISASHPWLSSLNKPRSVGAGWPVVLIALLIEVQFLITIINPNSKWAFKDIVRKQNQEVEPDHGANATKGRHST